jgi:(R,R)-butanediol dehydrogenase / meso-butanediol dehydrogenase / diacetyl reductase
MNAAVYYGQRDLRFETVPDPEPGPRDLIIQVGACGICGTDLEEFTAGPIFIPEHEPHPLTGRKLPLVMGHEFAGEVVEIGSAVTEFKVGDRIGPDILVTCGECYWCKRHLVSLCEKQGALGLHGDGGLAEFCKVPVEMCVPLPNGMPMEHAAIAEPVAVAVRAIRKGRVTVGEKVAIFGGGTIGLLCLQMARIAGASEVYVIEPLASRRELAMQLGATGAVDPREVGVTEWLLDKTKIGPDVVIEASGAVAAGPAAVSAARRAGRVVIVGVPVGPVEFNFLSIVESEVEVIGSISHVYDEDYTNAIWLLGEGRIEVDALITHRIPLSNVVEDGFNWLLNHQAETLKIIVDPQA